MPKRAVVDELKGRIGTRLRELRELKGLSQSELARAASSPGSAPVKQATVSRWESGASAPSAVALVRLCHELGVEPGTFLRGLGDDLRPLPPPRCTWTRSALELDVERALARLESDGMVVREIAYAPDERFWTTWYREDDPDWNIDNPPPPRKEDLEYDRLVERRRRYLTAERFRGAPEGTRVQSVFSSGALSKMVMDDERATRVLAQFDEYLAGVASRRYVEVRWVRHVAGYSAFNDFNAVWFEGAGAEDYLVEARRLPDVTVFRERFNWLWERGGRGWLDGDDLQAVQDEFGLESESQLLAAIPVFRARDAKRRRMALERRRSSRRPPPMAKPVRRGRPGSYPKPSMYHFEREVAERVPQPLLPIPRAEDARRSEDE